MNYVLSVLTFSIACSITYSAECKYKTYSPQHSGCKAANPNCKIKDSSMTSSDKNIILQLHNKQRNRVALGQETKGSQPKAADMKQLNWDNTLAELALKHAEQCIFEHDCNACRKTDDFNFVGQNIFSAMSGDDTMKKDWAEAINSWYGEVKDFSKNRIAKFDDNGGPTIGHYTQMVWANTGYIGCGAVKYTSKDPNMKLEILYVCNYGPAGNFVNYPVYATGEPCSKCPKQHVCSTEYPGLCKKSH